MAPYVGRYLVSDPLAAAGEAGVKGYDAMMRSVPAYQDVPVARRVRAVLQAALDAGEILSGGSGVRAGRGECGSLHHCRYLVAC